VLTLGSNAITLGGAVTTAGALVTSGAFALTLTATGTTNVTLPTSGTLTRTADKLSVFAATTSAELAGVISDETGSGALVFATAPTIAGGTHTGLTALGIRDTSAAFDVTLAAVSSVALGAGRTLTLDVVNAARTLKLGGNLTLAGDLVTSGAFALTLTLTGTTSVTLPTSGTLATLAGAEALSNKSYAGSAFALTALSTINANAAALPTPPTNTLLQLSAPDATSPSMVMETFAAVSQYVGRRAGNTAASPAATAAGTAMANFGAMGHTGSAYTTSTAADVSIQADAIWAVGDTSAKVVIRTTPIGSTTRGTAATFGSDKTLDVVGGYKANGTAGVSAGSFSTITAITTVLGIVTQLTGSSDERLKNISGPFSRGLADLLGIRPIRYRWNADSGFDGAAEWVGFSAQNVQGRIPEAIGLERWADGREFLTLNDRAVLATSVNAIRELAEENVRLLDRIDALEAEAKTKH
jgi:hypothetical protein